MQTKNISKDEIDKNTLDPKNKVMGLTPRALVIGIICVVLVVIIEVRALMGLGPESPGRTLAPSAIGIIILLLLLAVSRLFRLNLQKAEMVVIYAMVALVGPFVGSGGLEHVLITIFSPKLFFESNPRKFAVVGTHVAPFTYPQSDEAYFGFLIGNSPVPWGAWLMPLLYNFALMFSILFVYLCLLTLIMKRWTTVERLQYPLTKPVLAMIDRPQDKGAPDFFRNNMAKVGMVIAVLIIGLKELQSYFPAIPRFPLIMSFVPIHETMRDMFEGNYRLAWWRSYWEVTFRPLPLGIMYLAPLEILFSYWFFQVLASAYLFLHAGMGISPDTGSAGLRAMQETGMAATGIATLWLAREDIRALFRIAFKGESYESEETGTPLSPKVAAIGLILGPVLIIFLAYIGFKVPVWALLFWASIFLLGSLGFAKLRAEAGYPSMYWIEWHGISSQLWRVFPMSVGETGAAFSAYMTYPEAFIPVNANHAADSYRLSDDAKLKRSSMTWALIIAVVLSYVLFTVLTLNNAYTFGAPACIKNYADGRNWQWNVQIQAVQGLQGSKGNESIVQATYMIAGVLFVAFLISMRLRFVWWPFHPAGFLGQRGVGRAYGATAFVAWLIKLLVNRWGGRRLVDALQPFFMGLIIGDAGVTGLFAIIRFIFPRLN